MAYREGAQLTGTSLLPDGEDLGQLTGDAQYASTRLQVAHGLHIQERLAKEQSSRTSQGRDQDSSCAGLAAVVQDQHRDDDILSEDQSRLAVGAEGEAVAEVVRERDQVCACLEEVGQEGHALGGLRLDELKDLGDLDDGGGGDNADAETLADGILKALGVLQVDV